MKKKQIDIPRQGTVTRIQIHRLARIAALLKKNDYPNATDFLKEYYELEHGYQLINKDTYSTRTVYRDIELLRLTFGCPVAYSRRNNGYYLTDHNWTFECPTEFSESVMLPLIIGTKIAEDIFPNPLRNQLKSAVDQILKKEKPDFLDSACIKSLKIFAETGAVDISEHFQVVFNAWLSHHSLKITYEKEAGVVSERIVDPHVLFLYNKEWRIKAYCHLRKKPLTFVLSRIRKAELLCCEFAPDMSIIDSINIDSIVGYTKYPDVKIRLIGDAVKFAVASNMHTKQKITAERGGKSWIFSIPEISKEVITPWILSQGGNAIPLCPPEIVEDVREKASAISANLSSEKLTKIR